MSKKKKKAPPPAKKRFPVVPAIVVSVVLVAGLIVLLSASSSKHGQSTQTRSFSVTGGETRPVLNPYQFYGMVREAYAAAQAVPQILDKLFCYCYCHNVPFEHKSLLSCFVTRHGAG